MVEVKKELVLNLIFHSIKAMRLIILSLAPLPLFPR